MTLMQAARHDNYYRATARFAPHHPALQGDTTADVCVIGGGVAGCSAALHLAERGLRVVLLEAHTIGFGASGRSGGQLLPGYSSGQDLLKAQLGAALARQLWEVSVEAVQLTTQLIAAHGIECDLQYGHLHAAVKSRQVQELHNMQRELEDADYQSLQLLDKNELRDWVNTESYVAALYDSASAHLHPLNYTLGLAAAAQAAGVHFHERTRALNITGGDLLSIQTQQGTVTARHAVLCCNAFIDTLNKPLAQRIMPIGTYIIATEPLGEARMRSLLLRNVAVADLNFILDYFRASADHRLLFGGRVSYSGRDFSNTTIATRKRMLQVFPSLQDVRVDYSWGGLLDITLNRAPDFGRVQNNIFYLQGFSGHGMALAGMAGKLVAETLAGQAERFDVFTRIKHRPFPGGPLLRTPALVLAMLWYRLRDLL